MARYDALVVDDDGSVQRLANNFSYVSKAAFSSAFCSLQFKGDGRIVKKLKLPNGVCHGGFGALPHFAKF